MKSISILPDHSPTDFASESDGLVVLLDRIGANNGHRVGGKGANLGRMIQAGLPVPSGFCITTEAFRQFVASTPDVESMQTLLTSYPSKPIEELLATAQRLRERLAATPLPASIEQALLAALEKRDAKQAYAVRSSAVAEDGPNNSFAGQGETFLNVRGSRAILDRVRACWISLFSDRAILYRLHNRIDPRGAAMAVVVQEMICPEVSGVLFTAEPLTGNVHQIVIEASYGLGQALVSGETQCDRVVLAKPGLHVLEYRVGRKTVEVVPHETAGVSRRTVAPSRAEIACVDDETLRKLGRLALQAEETLGGPQDIEWTVTRQRVLLLQSRPITALRPKGRRPETVWSNMNSWEVLPGVVAPMSWSIVDEHFKSMFRPVLHALGIDINRQPLFGLIAGRAYANVNTFTAITHAVPLPGRLDFVDGLGGQHGKELAERLDRQEVDGRPTPLRRAARLLKLGIWAVTHGVDQRSKRDIDRFRRRLDDLAAAPLAEMSEAELAAHIAAVLKCDRRLGPDVAADVAVAVAFVHLFFGFLKRKLGREGDAMANRLLEGLGGLASAEAGLELWELAAWASRRPELSAAVMRAGDFASLKAELPNVTNGREFVRRWEQLMFRHGHHACGEFDVRTPRWSETPNDVLNMLRKYFGKVLNTSPQEFRRQAARRRTTLAQECRKMLGSPFAALTFDYLLRKAQFGVASRENSRNEVVRMLAITRRTLLELGRRLVNRGVLADPNDLFYLEMGELPQAVAGVDLGATITARKAEYAYYQTITPPPVVIGQFRPITTSIPSDGEAAQTLHGLPASAGVAIGPARVVLQPEAARSILPGEILIAPFTDPGWTPYFLTAAGIVMDIGGMLSHGSIVAREFGIPSVVNVGCATRAIHTGQIVRVDGNNGRVDVFCDGEGVHVDKTKV